MFAGNVTRKYQKEFVSLDRTFLSTGT